MVNFTTSGVITAADYAGNLTTLNTVWSTGSNNFGYGQTALSSVGSTDTISSAKWRNMLNTTANCGTHQNTALLGVTIPAAAPANDTISYTKLQNAFTNITSVSTSKLNAVSQGTTSANTATFGTPWQNILTFTHTATFANGDAARYFFNSGGQLAITCSHPTGTTINLLLSDLAANVGTLVFSSPIAAATATIAATSYTGFKKVGGGGTAPTTNDTTKGYYALGVANSNVFLQTASTGPASYIGTFINLLAKTTANTGVNGDNGNVLTFYTVWDEIPNGMIATSGTAVTLTLRPPEITNISNTWGTITLAGSVSGS